MDPALCQISINKLQMFLRQLQITAVIRNFFFRQDIVLRFPESCQIFHLAQKFSLIHDLTLYPLTALSYILTTSSLRSFT